MLKKATCIILFTHFHFFPAVAILSRAGRPVCVSGGGGCVLKKCDEVAPYTTLEEKEKEYQLAISTPIKTPADKFPKQNLDLSVEDGVFTVKGQYSEEGKTENGGYSSRFESFSRSVRLPENVDQDKIKADLKDGVLNVIFPKKENLLGASKVKKIPVEFADTAAATTATAASTEQTTTAAAAAPEATKQQQQQQHK
eukprot:g63919.t1